jgi:DnaJ-domain-containing protein 1
VDVDSVSLLESYLDRIDPIWRETHQQDSDDGNLNERQALAILGLESGASREEIIEAHRHLMQKLHPDRGGSTYLAAKLNEAKEYLLG